MPTYPSPPVFSSGERDSAWFVIHDPSGDRLVLTTGREAALRIQRGLLQYLREHNPPAAAVFRLDGAVGPRTLQVLYDYLLETGRSDLALAIYPEINRHPALVGPTILRLLLGVGWHTPPERIDLPVSSGDSLPYNRRAPAPRGHGADLAAIRAVMMAGGNLGDFAIVRDGRLAQRSAPVQAAGEALAVGSVRTVERSEDSLAPALPDDPAPTTSSASIVGTVLVLGLLAGGVYWLAR